MATICPICLTASFVTVRPCGDDSNQYNCATCGPYTITGTAEATIANGKKVDPRLSAWIREQQEFDRPPPEITSYTFTKMVSNLPSYTTAQKQLVLLKAIERRTRYPGFEVKLNTWVDYVLAWAANEDEFRYLLKALEERELVVSPSKTLSGPAEVIITPEGWDYLEKQESEIPFADQAFVAMSFRNEMDKVWAEGIKRGIENAGYRAVRVDKEPHIDRIDAKIVSEIKNSRFLVADVTGQNQGVYFEAGFALGLGRPVIWTIRKDRLDKVHFDTRQYNHIVWETTDYLAEELYFRICANIGKLSKSKSDSGAE